MINEMNKICATCKVVPVAGSGSSGNSTNPASEDTSLAASYTCEDAALYMEMNFMKGAEACNAH